MTLTAEQIDRANDLPTRREPVPEWGGEVILRTIPGTERDAFEASMGKLSVDERQWNWRSRMLALCLVDDAGARLYSDDQVERLGKKCGAVLDRLYDVAAAMNGTSAKAVKEAEKNSESAPSGASTSA